MRTHVQGAVVAVGEDGLAGWVKVILARLRKGVRLLARLEVKPLDPCLEVFNSDTFLMFTGL